MDLHAAYGQLREDGHPVAMVATPGTGLLEVLEMFNRHTGERLPVVNNAQERLLVGKYLQN